MNNFCIIGLGNPGEKYQKTRHNIGFRILEKFSEMQNSEAQFSFSQKHNAEIVELSSEKNKLFLVKPQTFMNNSGNAAHSVLEYHKISAEQNLLVVHDDVDLPFGKIRFSRDSGPAGHNGVDSVIRQLGTQNFTRLRFGIADPASEKTLSTDVFVLKNFSAEEEKKLPELIDQAATSIDFFLEKGFSETASRYN